MSVTVVSCVYGETFPRFIDRWQDYISSPIAPMNPKPDAVIVAADWPHNIRGAHVTVPNPCDWQHPQAYYLNHAIAQARTDWVWIVDIDDCAKQDALAGLEDVDADVWQMGYERSDGETYIPGPEALAADGNMLVAGSAIRREEFREVGGFRDVAFQDWDLWRRMRSIGSTFAFSGRTHFAYMRHQYTRSATELTAERRQAHEAEMLVAA